MYENLKNLLVKNWKNLDYSMAQAICVSCIYPVMITLNEIESAGMP
jgi:hypothetical protein